MDLLARAERALHSGAAGRCPFCIGLLSVPFKIGDKIHTLSDILAGAYATVVQSSSANLLRPGEVTVQLENQTTLRFCPGREIAQRLPAADRPEWFPPFLLTDAAKLHEAILRFCGSIDWSSSATLDWPSFYAVIGSIWRHRLPVDPLELGTLLTQHGAPEASAARLIEIYSHGRELLIVNCGRRPVMKKRDPGTTWL